MRRKNRKKGQTLSQCHPGLIMGPDWRSEWFEDPPLSTDQLDRDIGIAKAHERTWQAKRDALSELGLEMYGTGSYKGTVVTVYDYNLETHEVVVEFGGNTYVIPKDQITNYDE